MKDVWKLLMAVVVMMTAVALLDTGCATSKKLTPEEAAARAAERRAKVEKALPFVRPAVAAACLAGLTFGTDDQADRQEVAMAIASMAGVAKSAFVGQVPTTDRVKAALVAAGGEKYEALASQLTAMWALVLPLLGNDVVLAGKVLGEAAAGCEDAAKAVAGIKTAADEDEGRKILGQQHTDPETTIFWMYDKAGKSWPVEVKIVRQELLLCGPL